jgi:uncharacterized protein HemX
MTKILLVLTLLVGASAVSAQQRVEVSQEFIDTANKSFTEVVLLRQAVVSLEKALAAKDETIEAKNDVIKAKDQTIALRDEQVEFYRKLKCDQTNFFFGLIKNKRCH